MLYNFLSFIVEERKQF